MDLDADRPGRRKLLLRVALVVFVLVWLFGPYELRSAVPIWLPFLIALGLELHFFIEALGPPPARRADRGPQAVDRERYGYEEGAEELLLVREGGEELWVPYAGEKDEELETLIDEARDQREAETSQPVESLPTERRRGPGRGLLAGLGVIAVLALTAWFVESRTGWDSLSADTRAEAQARFSTEASRVAGHEVTIRCDESGEYVGAVQHADGVAAVGGNLAYLTPERCLDLYRLAFKDEVRSSQTARALAVLAHEAWHLRGVRDEATTECYALQSAVEIGQRLGLSRIDGAPDDAPATRRERPPRPARARSTSSQRSAATAAASTSTRTTSPVVRRPTKNGHAHESAVGRGRRRERDLHLHTSISAHHASRGTGPTHATTFLAWRFPGGTGARRGILRTTFLLQVAPSPVTGMPAHAQTKDSSQAPAQGISGDRTILQRRRMCDTRVRRRLEEASHRSRQAARVRDEGRPTRFACSGSSSVVLTNGASSTPSPIRARHSMRSGISIGKSAAKADRRRCFSRRRGHPSELDCNPRARLPSGHDWRTRHVEAPALEWDARLLSSLTASSPSTCVRRIALCCLMLRRRSRPSTLRASSGTPS